MNARVVILLVISHLNSNKAAGVCYMGSIFVTPFTGAIQFFKMLNTLSFLNIFVFFFIDRGYHGTAIYLNDPYTLHLCAILNSSLLTYLCLFFFFKCIETHLDSHTNCLFANTSLLLHLVYKRVVKITSGGQFV